MVYPMIINIFIQIMGTYVIIQAHRLGAMYKPIVLINACHLMDSHVWIWMRDIM